jgi:hypothetical protein
MCAWRVNADFSRVLEELAERTPPQAGSTSHARRTCAVLSQASY